MDGEARQLRLVATTDGLPLYEKLGFVETGIASCSIRARSPPSPRPRASPGPSAGDTDAITALDRAAYRHGPRGPRRGARRAPATSRSSATTAASRAMRRCAPSAAAR